MIKRIKTEVDIKYFKAQAIIEEYIINNSEHIYKIAHEGSRYIVKGFKIPMNHAKKDSTSGLEQVIEIYKQYFLLKAVCSCNPHIAKPLLLDHKIEILDNDYIIYIEILFECNGIFIHSSKHLNILKTYKIMQQSANVLLLFTYIGLPLFSLNDMLFNEKKSLLKIISITVNKVMTLGSLYERLGVVGEWAMCLALLVVKENIKVETEEDCKEVIEKAQEKVNAMKAKNGEQKEMKEFIKTILSKALKYDPKKESTIKRIVDKIKAFEEINGIQHSKSNTSTFIKLFFVGYKDLNKKKRKEEVTKVKTNECKNCKAQINKRVKMVCKHSVCKNCLITFALQEFVNGTLYNYSCACTSCNREQLLKTFTLDCGCEWNNFKEPKDFKKPKEYKEEECKEGHKLSISDSYLTNNFTSFQSGTLILLEHKSEDKELLTPYERNLKEQSIEDIVWVLKINKGVRNLDLSRYELKDNNAKLMGEVLKTNNTLKKLHIEVDDKEENKKEGIESICEAIRVNNTLEKLTIRGATQMVLEAMRFNRAIKSLEVKNNTKDKIDITNPLEFNKSLKTLKFSFIQIKTEALKVLSQALKTNKSLRKLELWNVYQSNEDTKIICKGLETNKILQRLKMKTCTIQDEGGKGISQLLICNKSIQILNLDSNEIRDETGKLIGQALKVNNTVIYLMLGSNGIGNEGTKAIAEGLKVNKSLQYLTLRHNEVADEGARAISEALKVNRTLEELDLFDNKIGNEGAKSIYIAMEINNKIGMLILHNNQIDAELLQSLNKKFNPYNRVS